MKVYVMTGSGGRWATNALEFDTEDEAVSYAKDLFGRWFAVTDWAVVPGHPTEPLEDEEISSRAIRRMS